MAIKRITPEGNIDRFIEDNIKNQTTVLIRNLSRLGERLVTAARTSGSYHDQTGNLRSSTGYVLAIDGQIVNMSSFEPFKEGKKGADEGKEYALQLISKFPQDVVLVVVAGMNYASYVSAKGYDVLDSSELLAEKLFPKMLERLKQSFRE